MLVADVQENEEFHLLTFERKFNFLDGMPYGSNTFCACQSKIICLHVLIDFAFIFLEHFKPKL
jgi:hypothetical protein